MSMTTDVSLMQMKNLIEINRANIDLDDYNKIYQSTSIRQIDANQLTKICSDQFEFCWNDILSQLIK